MDFNDVPKQVKPEMETNDVPVRAKLAVGTNDVHVSIKKEMDTTDVPMGVNDGVESYFVHVPIRVKLEMETNEIPAQVKGVETIYIPEHVKERMETDEAPVHVKSDMETNYIPVQIKKRVETKDVQLGVEIENLPEHVKEIKEPTDDPAQIKEELNSIGISLCVNEEMESNDVSEHEKDGMESNDVSEHEKDGMESDDVPEHETDGMESNDVSVHEKDGMKSDDVPGHETDGMESNNISERETDGMESNNVSEHETDGMESTDVPEQVREEMEMGLTGEIQSEQQEIQSSSSNWDQIKITAHEGVENLTKQLISLHTLKPAQQDTYYRCTKPCKVSLRRFNEKTQNGHCVADDDICLKNMGKDSYRIIPLHGKSVKRSEASSCCEDTDEDSDTEDEFRDIVLSDDESRDSSKTIEEEKNELIQNKKALLRLLKAQVKSNEKEGYFKMTPFVDDKTFNEYMTFNADLMCPVCKKTMTTFSEWKKHFYNWNACSAVFVNKKECCFTCPPCKESFDEFTSWSLHMFMAGPHGKMRHVAFPKGFFAQSGNRNNGHTSNNQISGYNPGLESVIDEKTKENSEQQNYQENDDFDEMFRFQVGFVCICTKTSVHRYETRAIRHIYEQHLKIGNHDRRYKCKVCSMYFHSRALKWQHYRKHHKLAERKKPKLCNICGKWYKYQSHLISHETREVPCAVCGSFIKENAIGKHLRNHYCPKRTQIHERQTCDICNKSFSKRAFQGHLDLHSERRRVHCSVCGKNLWPRCMRVHMLLHDRVKQFMCDICGKQFTTKSGLRYHTKKIHQKNSPEKETCTICGAKVVCMYQHMVKHKERKYICDVCGKKFSLKHHLKTHVKGVHENLRPFVCLVCGFKFTLRHHLESHMKTSHKGSIGVGKKETVEINSFDQIAFKNDKGNVSTGKTVYSRGKNIKRNKNKRKNGCPKKT